jgi:hypothetical protein
MAVTWADCGAEDVMILSVEIEITNQSLIINHRRLLTQNGEIDLALAQR